MPIHDQNLTPSTPEPDPKASKLPDREALARAANAEIHEIAEKLTTHLHAEMATLIKGDPRETFWKLSVNPASLPEGLRNREALQEACAKVVADYNENQQYDASLHGGGLAAGVTASPAFLEGLKNMMEIRVSVAGKHPGMHQRIRGLG
ncbi:MAG: hypothetical protein KDD70_15765 [Bdellovibrionales bacterium]|nr:hypothetical protein [Bdellovibrionales bacterium]